MKLHTFYYNFSDIQAFHCCTTVGHLHIDIRATIMRICLLFRMDENYNILPHGVNFQDAIFPDTSENRRTFSSLFQFSNCTQGSQPFHTFSPEWDTQEDSRVSHTLIHSLKMFLNHDRLKTLVQCDWVAGCHSNVCFFSLEDPPGRNKIKMYLSSITSSFSVLGEDANGLRITSLSWRYLIKSTQANSRNQKYSANILLLLIYEYKL